MIRAAGWWAGSVRRARGLSHGQPPAGSLQSPGCREHYRVAFFFPLQSHVGFPTRCPGGRRRAGEGVQPAPSRVLGPLSPPASSFARPWGGTCRTPAHEHFTPLCGEPAVAAGTHGFPPCPRPTSRWPRLRRVAPVDRATLLKCPGFSLLLSQLCCAEEGGRGPGPAAGGRRPLLPVGTFLPAPTPRFLPGLSGGGTCTIQRASCTSLFF